jgi:hypothetical protein
MDSTAVVVRGDARAADPSAQMSVSAAGASARSRAQSRAGK